MGTKKKKNNGQWIGILVYALIGAICGILFLQYFDHADRDGKTIVEIVLSGLLMIICLYGSLTLQIIVHEAGHLVFGLFTGYRFCSFRIFNLMWVRTDDRIRFRKMSVMGTGGQCLLAPPDLKDGNMPLMLYNFGGAIFNIVAGLVSVLLAFLFPVFSLWRAMLILFSIVGFAYALLNGLPLRLGPVNNDGRNALDMTHSKEATRAFWVQMKSNELLSRGVRLKDMPEEWFSVPSDESMKNAIIATVGVLACNRLMDERRFDDAEKLIEHLLSIDSGIVDLYRQLLTCDLIYMELIRENRAERVEKMRTKEYGVLTKTMRWYPAVLRTEYTYALICDGDREKAESIRKDFEDHAGRYPYPCEIEAERELMTLAMERYNIKISITQCKQTEETNVHN